MLKRTIGHEPGLSGLEKRRKIGSSSDGGSEGTISPQLTNEAYTVGWICAIPTECVAARLFLDKEHMRPQYKPAEDTNHYTLGEMGGHNVVIAVLPGGEYGTSSAANVASNMLRTFPQIRIGLMVGIGGGAPSEEHDIRLGDVVVSMPSGRNGGVLQYDFGKTVQGREFCMTGFLDQPPTVLRTSVCGLQVQYEMHGHCLNESIDITLQKWPKIDKKKYGRPDISTDRLYPANIVHHQQPCCSAATRDDMPEPMSRPQRTEDAHNPVVHYGLIGTANQLMKDALVRDRLSKEKGILCFEMEAAGLMNHFRCLVIRGICDYSDSHKNKDWQGYAAMAAAAYTKDLLCQIQPSDVVAEERLNQFVLESVSRIDENVEALKLKATRKEDLEVLDWVSSVDYGPQQSDFFKRVQPGTGLWFLQSVQYRDWLSAETKTLFCPGIPGAGKTILASIIIHDLWSRFREDASIGLAHIYINFRRRGEQTPEGLISSVLKQLAGHLVPLPEQVRRLYHDHRVARTRPSFTGLSDALDSTLGQYYRTYIVIDALDECDASTGCRDQFLSEIFRAQSGGKVSILVTSRNNPEIQNKFTECAILEIRANSNDVEKYVDNRISELPAFIRDNSSLQQDIKASINRTADGMFLLAQLYLDSLKGKLTLRAVRKALKDFVAGSDAYEHAYSSAMERINGQPREEADLARRILSWIAFARRPLVMEELRHALSVEAGMSRLDEDDLLQVDMASMCAGLVTVDKESDIIRLVHYTTQQYFEKSFQRWFGDPHLDITETCLTYLSFRSFSSGFARCYLEYEARLKSNPFYVYASCNWGYHARLAPTCQDVLPFLQRQSHVEATSQALIKSTLKSASVGKATVQGINGLHLAEYFGVEQVRGLVGLYDVNERDSYDARAILREVKSNSEDGPMWIAYGSGIPRSVLPRAIYHRDIDPIRMLLEKGVDIEARGYRGRKPLFYAISQGSKEAVRSLLRNRANFEARGDLYDKPLVKAIRYGQKEMVKVLLEYGASIKTGDGLNRTPLWYALFWMDEDTARMLLKSCVGIGKRDGISIYILK